MKPRPSLVVETRERRPLSRFRSKTAIFLSTKYKSRPSELTFNVGVAILENCEDAKMPSGDRRHWTSDREGKGQDFGAGRHRVDDGCSQRTNEHYEFQRVGEGLTETSRHAGLQGCNDQFSSAI